MSYHQSKAYTRKDLNILKCSNEGQPLAWISWRESLSYLLREKIAWQAGDINLSHLGDARNQQHHFKLHNIIGVHSSQSVHHQDLPTPRLSNHGLFARDNFLCLYCGKQHRHKDLSRDHVIPRSKGGEDLWTNCVAACIPCNQTKRDRTPEEANMPLLALPYAPSHIEGLLLKNRKILADQMSFLLEAEPGMKESRAVRQASSNCLQ